MVASAGGGGGGFAGVQTYGTWPNATISQTGGTGASIVWQGSSSASTYTNASVALGNRGTL